MAIWHLNLRHLAAVTEIARHGTISGAAQAVHLTQPAITQALGRLEQQLGVTLFERRHDGMTPTAAAALIVPRVVAAMSWLASPHVTMSRLRAFLALADAGSYSGASAASGLSLPSLHRSVSDLSLALRRTLVQRRGKGVQLTEAGLNLVRTFRLAQVELETAISEIEALLGHETRRIAIGAMPLSRARVLPRAVTRFLRRHPQVILSISEGSRAELVEPLRSGAIDVMIGALREPLHEADLEQEALFNDVPVVLGRKGHPLAGTIPSLEQLVEYPWISAASGAPLRDSFERLFAEAGMAPPKVPIMSGSVMMIRQVLIDSDCLTMLSRDQVALELDAGILEVISPVAADLGRRIGVTKRNSWRPTAVHSDFLAELRLASEELN